MRRKLNYTDRKKIPKKNCIFSLYSGNNGDLEFKSDLDISNIGFPDDSSVYIEAYYRSSVMRFHLGNVGNFKNPFTSRLGDIQSEVVFFRVKVVDKSDSIGKIIGLVDHISPESDIQKFSLLPVSYRDLGDRIWRLDLDSPAPILEVNNNFRSTIAIGEVVRKDPAFLTLVIPAVLREILSHILFIDEHLELDDESWQSQWLKFSSSFPGVNKLEDLPGNPKQNISEYRDWIEDVVDSFGDYHHIRQEFEKWVGD